MADSRRYGLTPQLDIEQILLEAQNRWLRPAEICEILQNYTKFRIAPEPPNKPPSGSLFLFDRKVLRYFRKDGHNWRKKKDGKTVKEAHERLKTGSVDVLHCYYAHGEENENFQRRSYWMLEEDLMHIVLVHYREVKGGRSSANRARNVEDMTQVSNMDSPDGSNSNSITNQSQLISQVTDAESPNSAHTSEYEDAESDYYQRRSRHDPNIEMQRYDDGSLMDAYLTNQYAPVPSLDSQYVFHAQAGPKSDLFPVAEEDTARAFDETGLGLTFSGSTTQLDLTLDEVLKYCTTGFQAPVFQSLVSYTHSATSDISPHADPLVYESSYTYDLSARQANITTHNSLMQISNDNTEPIVTRNISIGNDALMEGGIDSAALKKQQPMDLLGSELLKKYDSFSRWANDELEEVDHSHINISPGAYWSVIGNGVTEDSSMPNHEHLDTYIMSPSLSQDQLFSIDDFSPGWAYCGLKTKVLVTGTFLNKDVEKYKWSCMFGEIEVPADVIKGGTLCCYAPAHKSGRVSFYVTCSNRLACSEVREFEYRENDSQYLEASDFQYNNVNEMLLHIRLDKLLSLGPNDHLKQSSDKLMEKVHLINKINSIMKEADDECSISVNLTSGECFLSDNAEEQLLEALLREKLHSWLLQKVAEDGKGPSVWDEEGQGVLHLAAALGYTWAIKPAVAAGVNINFRDVHGWTALHWAASCGRVHTVADLLAMGAAPGLLTDPTPEHPSGRTPADLASANGHKGIAGFLAESSLTSHLQMLTVKDSKGSNVADIPTSSRFVDTERGNLQVADEDSPAGLSLKDSLTAVRNASQAAARIYQVFRVHSFNRKKLVDCGNEKSGMSNEHALSRLSVKSVKPGQHDMPLHAAATRIQNKFRGWKGRKDFLIIRQRIVKIQAHVRGHQVRKHFRKIVWSVGIVEKVILRWRRKGQGLRGFRSESLSDGPKVQNQQSKEDDYDFLQEGRKQTEARLQKALDRVKSMVQYPEARDQYRRLLTVVTELQEAKASEENPLDELEAEYGDLMIELEEICEADTIMLNA